MNPGTRHLSCALIACLGLIGCNASPARAVLDSSASPQGREYRINPEALAQADAAPPSPQTQPRAVEVENFDRQPRQITESEVQEPAGEDVELMRPQIIYTAMLGIQVDRVTLVQARAQSVVERHGGYIGQSEPGRMVLRVPATRFDAALNDLAALGEVTQRRVEAQDASERVVDLESRLLSLNTMRDRLVGLIERANNVEHALQAERELARVIEQIELIQGRLRLARQQIAYATITMSITPTPVEQRLTPGIPIQWVRDLGTVFNERTQISVTSPSRLRDGVTVDLPSGFIRTYQQDYVTQAVDANGVRIRVRRFENFDEGVLRFWEQLVTRSLTDYADLALEDSSGINFERGGPGRLITGERQIAGETVRYVIALGVSSDGDHVYAFEAWGVAEHFDSVELEIARAMGTMRCY